MPVVAMLCGATWERQKEQNRRIWDACGTAPTLTAICGGGQHLKVCKREREREMQREVYRRLAPKEYWRLMGFTDKDFEKAASVNSETQLYKQAGNSIVVQVLEAIFKEMLE